MIALDAQAAFIFTPLLALVGALVALLLVIVAGEVLPWIATTKILRAIFGAPSPKGGDDHVDAARVHIHPVARAGVPPRAALSSSAKCYPTTLQPEHDIQPEPDVETYRVVATKCPSCRGRGRFPAFAITHQSDGVRNFPDEHYRGGTCRMCKGVGWLR